MAVKEHVFQVTITVDASFEATKRYVENALGGWGGQYHPEDPFFGENKRVVVKRTYRTFGTRR